MDIAVVALNTALIDFNACFVKADYQIIVKIKDNWTGIRYFNDNDNSHTGTTHTCSIFDLNIHVIDGYCRSSKHKILLLKK